MSAPPAARARARKGSRAARDNGQALPHGRSTGRLPSKREAATAFLHLAAAWGFAVVQPLLDLLGRNAEFFAARGMEGLEVPIVALALTLGPPLALLVLELAAGAVRPSLRRALHLVFIGGLVAVLALQVVKRVAEVGAVPALLLAALVGSAVALAYARTPAVRTFLSALSPAPLVFLALFLASPPVAKLVFGDEDRARSAKVSARAPVVFVLFDELPLTTLLDQNGRIDARRYPNFAALAATSTWFRNATGAHDRTSKAVPAAMTGDRPRSGQLPVAAEHPKSIFALLGESYRMNVHEEATSVCPDDLCAETARQGLGSRLRSLGPDLAVVLGHVVLPEDLAARLPSVSEGWEGFAPGDEATEPTTERASGDTAVNDLKRGLTRGLRGARDRGFDGFVASLGEAGEERTLSFAHVLFPHAPFEYLPSGRRYHRSYEEPIEGLVPPSGTEPLTDPFAAHQLYARHLLQAAYADRLLGQVLARLRERELLGRSLVVVTADHGATFGAGRDRRTVTPETFADIASVPLLVKAPGQERPEVRDAYVQTTEVLPTVADVLDVRLPWRVAGRSAFDPAVGRRRTVSMIQGDVRRARISRGGRDRPITLSVAAFEREQQASLARKFALFGPRSDPFALGPHPELRGRRLTELAVARAGVPGARAELDAPRELDAVDPRSSFVPSHLTGRVRSAALRKRALAIAVNGRVAAVGESFFLDGQVERWSVLVPEAAFRPGSNQVEVFEVAGSGPRLRLTPLGRFGA